jgi:hypothetical protein
MIPCKVDNCELHGYILFELKWHGKTSGMCWKCVACAEKDKKKCERCKNTFKTRQLRGNFCVSCIKQILEEKRKEKREKQMKLLKTYDEKLKSCKNGGICDTLQMHHDILKDDPERLQTDFIIGMVCGKEMQEKYRNKQMGRIR